MRSSPGANRASQPPGIFRSGSSRPGSASGGGSSSVGAGVGAADIDEAYLAGGFGTRLDIESAAKAGLIPQELAGKTRGIGNAALDGAQRVLCTPGGFERLTEIQGRCEYVELSGSAEFSEAFVDAMPFYDDEEEA